MATVACAQKVFLGHVPFSLNIEPNSRALLSGHFGPSFSLSNTSRVPARPFRTAPTLRVSLSGHFGLHSFSNTSRVPVRPFRTFLSLRFACSCPVISDCSLLSRTLPVFLPGHFGLLSPGTLRVIVRPSRTVFSCFEHFVCSCPVISDCSLPF